jgi:hypothetical protein
LERLTDRPARLPLLAPTALPRPAWSALALALVLPLALALTGTLALPLPLTSVLSLRLA